MQTKDSSRLVHALVRFADFFGAHRSPQKRAHERDRALQRAVVAWALALWWVGQYVFDVSVRAAPWYVVCCVVYGAIAIAYRHVVRTEGGAVALYAFLIIDPIFSLGALVEDADTLAFLNPFLLVIIVRTGIRYGVRTMYLSLAVTLVACPILLASRYWERNVELTLAFILMLALVPAFFASLIRKIHQVRALEEERARLLALHELAVARNAFLAKVSHELRSPLQSIVSALDVIEMRQRQISPDDQELLGRMRHSSLLLNSQLRDLLTLAKGEAGRLQMHPEAFDAVALVEATVDSLNELALAKGLDLTTDLPRGPLFVVADGARIDQVLTNLVINSIRYTESGQVRISMVAEGPPSALRFVVADTGPGIPQDVLPTLLEPDKVVTSPVRRGEGSGIGLAIVRTLVGHLGGTVAVTSQAGRGTSFTVHVPAEPVDPDSSDGPTNDSAGRILVVDDRDEVRHALVSVLDELGFECDSAPSAAAGANFLAARRYGAALLDVEMPLKSGAELAAETRRGNGPNRGSRLIAMSAAERAEEWSQFDACLTKPIDRAALRQVLLGVTPGFSKASQPGLWLDEG